MKVASTLRTVRDSALSRRQAHVQQHPNWNSETDARITTFTKLITGLNSTALALTFMSQSLLTAKWWEDSDDAPSYSPQSIRYAWEFGIFAKVGCVQLVFSAVESGFRIVLRAIDPAACSGGTAEFKPVYDCLLCSKLASTPADGIQLLDLLRVIRNSIHNNGVYFHRNQRAGEILYRGVRYEYQHGQAIEFATWSLLAELSAGVVELVDAVVADPIVTIIPSIADPYLTSRMNSRDDG